MRYLCDTNTLYGYTNLDMAKDVDTCKSTSD